MVSSSRHGHTLQLACEICLIEVPPSHALGSEGHDYVLFVCGIECYAQWDRQRYQPTQPEEVSPMTALPDHNYFNEQLIERDPHDGLGELPEWNREIALELARTEGIELTDEHWEVLHFLRRRFATHGQARYARLLGRELDECLAARQGHRHLYELFPGGPVTQGSRIAGLPAPAYHADLSFGSVQ